MSIHLSKAPIKEAILEFQLLPHLDIEQRHLDLLYAELKSDYAEPVPRSLMEYSFNEKGIVSDQKYIPLSGGIFRDESRKFVFIIETNKFLVSKLEPYDTFDNLIGESKKILNLINSIFNLDQISRIGLRYRNKIEIKRDISYYLKNDGISYYYDNNISYIDSNHTFKLVKESYFGSNINIIISHSENTLIIDTDTYNKKIMHHSDKDLWEVELPKMRDLKNEVFYNILTEEFIEEIK